MLFYLIATIVLSIGNSFSPISQQQMLLQLGNKNTNFMNQSSRFFYSSRSQTFTTAQSQVSSQQQTTAISLDSDALRSPHTLSISTQKNTQLVGKIAVNGVEIKKLQGSRTEFNLSPYLKKGDNRIEINGEYQPVSSTVAIEFSGLHDRVSQQVGGNGKLRQVLAIAVR